MRGIKIGGADECELRGYYFSRVEEDLRIRARIVDEIFVYIIPDNLLTISLSFTSSIRYWYTSFSLRTIDRF